LDHLSERLQASPFLMGQTFTVADAYLFTTLTWTPRLGLDLAAKWPALASYVSRLRERPTVRKAMQAEGL
jgi:glutathione S-transferase